MNRNQKRPGTIKPMHLPPRAKWKMVAVSDNDPTAFALLLEETMNELVSEGWHIQGMIQRGEALVVTAIKPEIPEELRRALAEAQGVTPRAPRPPPPDRDAVQEVLYNYQEAGEVHSMRCDSLGQAKSYLEEHVQADGDILPISIVVMSVTSYEPADLPTLRKMFPKES